MAIDAPASSNDQCSPAFSLSSHDEWSALKEVVVGSAVGYLAHERDLSFELFFHDNLFRSDWAYPRLTPCPGSKGERYEVKRRYVRELIADVESFCETLTELGVNVLRPVPLPADAPTIRGLGWEAAPTPALNIRDNTLVLGSEVIETPPAVRSRYLESRLLAPLFRSFFERGATWTTMPRPVLTDRSFDLSYANSSATTLGGPTESIQEPTSSPFDVGIEMMLDGAQCLRLGRDLVVNVATENHVAALRWLERHLDGRLRVHPVYRMSDNHIDSMILALKPGVFLARDPSIRDHMPAVFRRWKYLVPPPPDPGSFPVYDDEDLVLTSPYIDLNVLSISQEVVVVNEQCIGLRKLLESEGFDVVPVRHRHRRLFGGGFHCFTLDTHREGDCQDYT